MVGGGPEVGMSSHRMSSEEILGRSPMSILRMVPEYYTTIRLHYYHLLLYYFTSKLLEHETTILIHYYVPRRLGGGS